MYPARSYNAGRAGLGDGVVYAHAACGGDVVFLFLFGKMCLNTKCQSFKAQTHLVYMHKLGLVPSQGGRKRCYPPCAASYPSSPPGLAVPGSLKELAS